MIDASSLATLVKPLCLQAGVLRLELVGSAARTDFDDATSEVDFLVDYKDQPGFDYFTAYMALRAGLEKAVGRPVDLITARGIENPYLRESLAQDALLLYAA